MILWWKILRTGSVRDGVLLTPSTDWGTNSHGSKYLSGYILESEILHSEDKVRDCGMLDDTVKRCEEG